MPAAAESAGRDGDAPVGEARAVAEEATVLLYRHSKPAAYFSVGAAALLAVALWDAVPRAQLAVWLAAVVAMGVVRVALFAAFERQSPAGSAVLAWRRRYLWTLGIAAAVWGFGGLLLAPADSLLHQVAIYVFLVGMGGSALTTYAALGRAALVAFLPVLLPYTLWLLWAGGNVRIGLGCAGLLLLAGGIRAIRLLSDTQRRNIVLRLELDAALQTAECAARTDPMTGLPNRRDFAERGAAAVDYCRRHGLPVAVLVLDIDGFKAINDSHGHAAGDAVLVRLGTLLAGSLRGSDVCGRIGGEEFALVLPHTSAADALAVAEKLRAAFAGSKVSHGDLRIRGSISIGVAGGAGTLEALLRRADAAMYRAKAGGRDRVETETAA